MTPPMKNNSQDDLVDRFSKLTRQLESTVGRLLGTQSDEMSEPLELVNGILRNVEQRVEPIGGGRRRFPFTEVGVVVLAARKEDQDRVDSALTDLDARIRERLQELACEPPSRLDVSVQFARKPRKHWAADQRIELLFSRDTPAARTGRDTRDTPAATGRREPRGEAAASPSRGGSSETAIARPAGASKESSARAAHNSAAPPATRIVVLKGSAAKRTYSLEQAVIRFGRGEEHAEASGRTRRNDIAFADDEDETNRTVARAQAHLRFDADRREFRVFDDGSSNGTRVIRESDIITVTPHGPRGVRVVTGDILELGRARLRIDIDA
jgi:hypothetical protein